MDTISLIIAGDLGPTRSNYSLFSSGNIEGIVDRQLLNLLSSADIRIFNLEVPLTDDDTPIRKDGPVLGAPLSTINGIKLLDPSIVTIANNHIFDHGEEGLKTTIEQLSGQKIQYVGAGLNINEASQPVIIERQNCKIGVYACAEHEFSIADEVHAGANPMDLLESFEHISSLKSKSDKVIVLHHGGKEHYRYPSPELQKICRKMVSSGADLVVCQHSHCIGSYEKYGNGIIVYGQGNFLFDRRDDEFWSTGILVRATIGESFEVEFLPIIKSGNGVKTPEPPVAEKILSDFFHRSEQITLPGFVEEEFERYCLENGQYYLATLAGLGTTIRRADKVLKRPLTRLIYTRRKMEIIRNHFECETHRELILKYLEILTRNKHK
jgi:poly-gamma-glutamate synthesis protein (capsule biosynthesis protein)